MGKAKEKKKDEFAAPFLPSLDRLPDRPDLVALVPEYPRYKHTSTTLQKNEQLCVEIIQWSLEGKGVKRISKQFGVSPHSVRALRRAAEQQGILAPLKERLGQKYAAILEESADEMIDRIQAGTVPDNVLPVMHGVIADKKAALDGVPSLVVEHRHAVSLNVQAVNDFFSKPPIDIESGVLPPVHQQIECLPAAGCEAGCGSAPAELAADLAEAAAEPASGAGADTPGGGSPLATGAESANGTSPTKFGPKGSSNA